MIVLSLSLVEAEKLRCYLAAGNAGLDPQFFSEVYTPLRLRIPQRMWGEYDGRVGLPEEEEDTF